MAKTISSKVLHFFNTRNFRNKHKKFVYKMYKTLGVYSIFFRRCNIILFDFESIFFEFCTDNSKCSSNIQKKKNKSMKCLTLYLF